MDELQTDLFMEYLRNGIAQLRTINNTPKEREDNERPRMKTFKFKRFRKSYVFSL